MAKRGTTKPLRILAHKSILCEELNEAKAKGNTVDLFPEELEGYDVIFGPNVWRMVEGLERLIPVALTAARNVKYKKVSRKADLEEDDDD